MLVSQESGKNNSSVMYFLKGYLRVICFSVFYKMKFGIFVEIIIQ